MTSKPGGTGGDDLAVGQAEPAPSERRSRSGALRLGANIGSLLSSTAFERATRFVLYALVARTLGATDFGRLALAIAIFQVVGRFVVVGIPVLATRDVAKHRERVAAILVNGWTTVAATATVGYGLLLLFVSSVGYEQETVQVIWLLFVGLLPFGWSQISESIFIGLERAKYIAFVNVPVNLAQVVTAFVILRLGYGIGAIAFSLAMSYVLIGVIQVAVIATQIRPSWTRPDIRVAIGMVKAASPFLGIEGTVVVRGSSAAVVISLVLGEAAVGIFSAASQLQMPLRLVGSSIGSGLFPVLVRAYGRGISALATVASRSVEIVVAALLPAAAGLVILASELLTTIYGGQTFAESAVVLRLVAAAGLAMAVASILGRVLVSAGKELVTLRITTVNTASHIVLTVALTIRFGIVGAAAAYLVAALLNIIQHYVPIRRLFGSFQIWPILWRPGLAAMVMAVVLSAFSDAPVLAQVGIGFSVNLATLLGVSLWSAGGREGLRQRWTLVD